MTANGTRPGLVNLDELIDSRLAVVLGGREIPVKPIDGIGFQLITGLTAETGTEKMYEVAARCLPSLQREDVLALTPAQVGAVVKLASEGVEKVEAASSPNGKRAGAKRGGKVRLSSPA